MKHSAQHPARPTDFVNPGHPSGTTLQVTSRGPGKVTSRLTSHRHFVVALRMGRALLPNALLTLPSRTNLMTTWARLSCKRLESKTRKNAQLLLAGLIKPFLGFHLLSS